MEVEEARGGVGGVGNFEISKRAMATRDHVAAPFRGVSSRSTCRIMGCSLCRVRVEIFLLLPRTQISS